MGRPNRGGHNAVPNGLALRVLLFVVVLIGLLAETAQVFPVAANEITDQLTLEMHIPKALSRAEERALKPKD